MNVKIFLTFAFAWVAVHARPISITTTTTTTALDLVAVLNAPMTTTTEGTASEELGRVQQESQVEQPKQFRIKQNVTTFSVLERDTQLVEYCFYKFANDKRSGNETSVLQRFSVLPDFPTNTSDHLPQVHPCRSISNPDPNDKGVGTRLPLNHLLRLKLMYLKYATEVPHDKALVIACFKAHELKQRPSECRRLTYDRELRDPNFRYETERRRQMLRLYDVMVFCLRREFTRFGVRALGQGDCGAIKKMARENGIFVMDEYVPRTLKTATIRPSVKEEETEKGPKKAKGYSFQMRALITLWYLACVAMIIFIVYGVVHSCRHDPAVSQAWVYFSRDAVKLA